MAERDPETGQFVPGHTGMGGRPRGSRNKLGEAFLEALNNDFREHGVEAIKECRKTKPDVYVKTIASLLPRDVNLNVVEERELTDDQLIERMRKLSDTIAPFIDGGIPETRH